MKKGTGITLLVLGLGVLVGVGWMAGQETPRPPAPPAPPSVRSRAFAVQAPFPGVFLDGGAWLGVRLSDVTPDRVRELKLTGESGAVVEEVEEESPAAKAGLARNDVIVEYAGERVWSVSQLQRMVRETPPGRTVTLRVSRDGKPQTMSVKVETREARAMAMTIQPPRIEFSLRGLAAGTTLGVSGEDLTRQLADYFGVKQGKGVLVREVVVGSAAEKAGLKAGDVIVRVEGTDVGTVTELRRALPRDLSEKRKVSVTIVRDRREQTLTVELEPARRYSPRQAELLGPYGIDQDELRRLADEARALAEQVTREKMEDYRGLMEEYQHSIQDWRKQWEQEQRKLQEEMMRLKLKAVELTGNQTI